jgi:hydroxyacylglutathione hydrolase
MKPLAITPIPAFSDNYFWLLERDGRAAIVDPGDAAPVERALDARGLALAAILVMHHHMDHIGGLRALRTRHDVPVYGPAAEAGKIPDLTATLREGDRVGIDALELELSVWEVPGHTLGHIAYLGPGFVLCGDTLFSAGCGRLFEGTAAQLHHSLERLAGLPPATQVFCTHEYTAANLAFAAAVEPDSAALRAEIARVRGLRERGLPSLPSTIGHEQRINPFLRVREPAIARAVAAHAGAAPADALETFAALRRWKDTFRPPVAT